MNKGQVSILSESGHSKIIKFKGSGHIGVIHKNLLLYFTPDRYVKFAKNYEEIDFLKHSLLFPDYKQRMIMNTPVSGVQFCFTKPEFEQFRHNLMEASVLVNANMLINRDSA